MLDLHQNFLSHGFGSQRAKKGREAEVAGASHWGPSPTPLFQEAPQVCTSSSGQKTSRLEDTRGLGTVGLTGSVPVPPLAPWPPEPASRAGLLTRHIPPGPGRSAHLWSRNLPVGADGPAC